MAEILKSSMQEQAGATKPSPDPTTLTTEQMLRENKWLKELMEARLNAIEHTMVFVQKTVDSLPMLRQESTDQLQKIVEERFRSIALQFTERDTRVEQTSKDRKFAVDAALSAAKEAVTEQNKSTALSIAKSETAFIKQLDQLILLVNSQIGSLTTQLDDMKNWQTRQEGKGMGSNTIWGYIVGGVGIVGIIISIVMTMRGIK